MYNRTHRTYMTYGPNKVSLLPPPPRPSPRRGEGKVLRQQKEFRRFYAGILFLSIYSRDIFMNIHP